MVESNGFGELVPDASDSDTDCSTPEYASFSEHPSYTPQIASNDDQDLKTNVTDPVGWILCRLSSIIF